MENTLVRCVVRRSGERRVVWAAPEQIVQGKEVDVLVDGDWTYGWVIVMALP